MPSLSEAQAIVRKVAPDLPWFGVAFVVAIAGLESGLGEGFLPHHNWGAITAGSGWNGPTFEHEDKRWTESGVETYTTNFRDYADDEAAAKGLVDLLRSQYGKALSAAEAGNWYEASCQLYKAGYYTGTNKDASVNIANHFKALSSWLVKQGISPGLIAGAALLEALFWTALAVFGLRAIRKRK